MGLDTIPEKCTDIMKSSKIGLWVVEGDEVHNRMYCDETMFNLLGITKEMTPEEVYTAWYSNIEADQVQVVDEAIEKMLEGKHAEVQYVWNHPTKGKTIVRCGGNLVQDYKEGVRLAGAHQDVTDLFHLQTDEENLNMLLRQNLGIIEGLASEYTSVYYINLATGEYTPFAMNKEDENAFGLTFDSKNKFYEAYNLYVNLYVDEDEKEKMLSIGTVDNIRKQLIVRKSFSTIYVNHLGKYCEMKIVRVGGGLVPAYVVVGFAEKDAEIRSKIEREKMAKRDMEVIAGLSEDFGCVVYVDLADNKEIHYRIDDMIEKAFPGWTQIDDFALRMQLITENMVHPDDKMFFKNSTEKKYVIERLRTNKTHYVNFRVMDNDVVIYYQLKFVLSSDGQYVIAGFKNVDNETRRELSALNKAEAANKAKTTFLSNMSHDIRTPMNAVMGFTDMAIRNIDDRERTLEFLGKAKTASEYLLTLINDILDMTLIESGRIEIKPKADNISSRIEKIVPMLNDLANRKEINFTFNNNIVDEYAYFDLLRLEQVIINVVSNAVKYTDEKGKVIFNVNQQRLPGNDFTTYYFEVIDNGIGMSEEFQKIAFDTFSREKNSTVSKKQGTGLGLAITKSVVDMMGGTIEVKSELGKGTRFLIAIPLNNVENTNTLEEVKQNEKNETISFKGKRLLLVDDNEFNLEIAKEILEDEEFVVEEASDGKEAVDMVNKNGADYYDAILMDVQMPVMNGYEATKTIRDLFPQKHIPILALSANAFEEDREKSLEAGMDEHLSKPIMVSQLFDALRRFI